MILSPKPATPCRTGKGNSYQYPIDPKVLRRIVDPRFFIIKLTPLNPTIKVDRENLKSDLDPLDPGSGARFVKQFREAGFEVVLSIGELEENLIGSNCGQYIQTALETPTNLDDRCRFLQFSL